MKQILHRLFEHQYLGREETRDILQNIVEGRYDDSQIASLITVFPIRSISVEELTGLREALLGIRVSVDLGECRPIDVAGTGGGGENTSNISVRSCLVVTGASYHVVKHDNYGVTSVNGINSVMGQHGIRLTNDIDKLHTSVDTYHIAYLHVPLFNLVLKAVAPVRKNLGMCSFFNMLSPLVSPVTPTYQSLGVCSLPLLRLYNYMCQEGGTRFAMVHNLDGYDEISLMADFKVAMPEKEKLYTPEILGFKRCAEADLGGDEAPEEAARIFDAVLENRTTEAQRGHVIANSVFVIQMICLKKEIEVCIAEAHESLENGKALATFCKPISLNH